MLGFVKLILEDAVGANSGNEIWLVQQDTVNLVGKIPSY
jgi:hypothetical protein